MRAAEAVGALFRGDRNEAAEDGAAFLAWVITAWLPAEDPTPPYDPEAAYDATTRV